MLILTDYLGLRSSRKVNGCRWYSCWEVSLYLRKRGRWISRLRWQ